MGHCFAAMQHVWNGRYWRHSGHSETPPPEIILAKPIYMSRHRFIV